MPISPQSSNASNNWGDGGDGNTGSFPSPKIMNVNSHLFALHLADFVISKLICMLSSQRYRKFNVNSQHYNINLVMLNYILPKGTILKLW